MGKDKIGLIYKGNGFFVSVPARDLKENEVDQFGGKDFLLSLGLYEEPYQPPPKPKKAEVKVFDDEPLDEESEE